MDCPRCGSIYFDELRFNWHVCLVCGWQGTGTLGDLLDEAKQQYKYREDSDVC